MVRVDVSARQMVDSLIPQLQTGHVSAACLHVEKASVPSEGDQARRRDCTLANRRENRVQSTMASSDAERGAMVSPAWIQRRHRRVMSMATNALLARKC